MATQNPQESPPGRPHLPLVARPSNRGDDPNFDARMLNGFVEKGKDGELHVYQRGGLSVITTLSGNGRGVYNWLGAIYAVFGTTLYKDGVSKGTVDGTGGVYTFSSGLGSVPKLFLQNGVTGYTYDDAGGLVAEVETSTVVTTGDTHTTAIIDNIPSTTGFNAGTGVVGSGVVAGSYVVTVDSATQVTINVATTSTLVGTALTFTTSGFQTSTVKGSAYLDGTTYVMTAAARIYGSELNDPTTWKALNFLTAQIEPDGGVFLAKQLAYVVAFKQWSTEVFYDAGNPTGSPLATVQGAKQNHGCRHAGSVQDAGGTLLWISATREGAVGVHKMEGLKVLSIGSPPVERLLQNADSSTVWSWSFKLSGHRFYGVTFKEDNLTLVYDLDSEYWAQWTDTNGNYFPFVAATYTTNQDVLLQHETDGKLYKISLDSFTDNGSLISWELFTPNYDAGTLVVKTLHRMAVLADQRQGSILEVRTNDSDYDPTKWTNFRRIDLGKKYPYLQNCGSFKRRAMHFRHRCNAPLRIQVIELHMEQGSL